jgi:DNA-binding NarL/FixJ family response regulator
MEIRNPQKIKATKKEAQDEVRRNKTRILIVGDHPIIQKELCQLFNHEADLEICIEAKDTDQAQGAIGKQQIDLAIVNISSKDTNGFKVADTIKFQYSNIPIVLLSIHDEALHAKNTLRAEAKEPLLNCQATERIIKAIRYTQSLLRSQIFVFTLVVNLERSPQDDY